MRLQTGNESYILSCGLKYTQINQVKQPSKKYLRMKRKGGPIYVLLLDRSNYFKQSYILNFVNNEEAS